MFSEFDISISNAEMPRDTFKTPGLSEKLFPCTKREINAILIITMVIHFLAP